MALFRWKGNCKTPFHPRRAYVYTGAVWNGQEWYVLQKGSWASTTAEALHKITKAHVKVETIPTWPHEVRREYSSPWFPLPNIEVLDRGLSQPSFVDLAAVANNIPTMASTPVREDESDIVPGGPTSDSVNVCSTCGVRFDSEADKNLKSPWMGCARKGCPFWVHATRANIYYKDTEQGSRALGKWAERHFFAGFLVPCYLPITFTHPHNHIHLLLY